MKAVTDVLDQRRDGSQEAFGLAWFREVEESLQTQSDLWKEAIEFAGALEERKAWTLLSWVELAATNIVREGRQATLENAAFAMAILENSPLEWKDRSIVASLLRRAAVLAGLDFVPSLRTGCSRAGRLGEQGMAWLISVSPATPDTHEETVDTTGFTFQRVASDFDVSTLETWLEGGEPRDHP